VGIPVFVVDLACVVRYSDRVGIGKKCPTGLRGLSMSGEKHADPSSKWLFFFFVCFGIVMLGIVLFFARDINTQPAVAPGSGGHGGMILPIDGEYAPHVHRLPIA
jgi:hypothetical protein